MKKLPLNVKKCKKLHMGKNNNLCPDLKAHKDNLINADKEKYLGDQISNDGENKSNISERKGKGIGIVSQIMSLLDDICLGKYYFQTAVKLRESYLVNGILFNAEVWYDLKEQEIRELEEIDETLLRRILNAHSKTPIEALYLELGCLPLRHIIMARRINYLFYLANLNENELLFNFFLAQVKSPQKGDWILTMNENLEEIGLDIDIDKMIGMNQDKFKKIVKSAIQKAGLSYLLLKASSHSKMDNLQYIKKHELQSYLKHDKLKKHESQTYFKFRTRMEDFKENFKNGSTDTNCSLCTNHDSSQYFPESQKHFLKCTVISDQIPEISKLFEKEIYSTEKVNIEAVKTLLEAIEIRKLLLSN